MHGVRFGARRRGFAVAALLLSLWLVVPASASAHAELESSDPASNATLLSGPRALTLEFSEPIDPATVVVQLLDEHAAVDGVGSAVAEGARLNMALPELAPGLYSVDYRVTSAVDGHVTSGAFVFLVDPTGTLPAPAVTPTTDAPTTDAAMVAARWVGLLGLLVLVGTAFFWLSARRAIDDAIAAPWPALAAVALVAFTGHAVYLSLAARPLADPAGGHGGHGGLTGFPLDFAAPFGWTPFGTAMRLVLAATAVVFLVAAARWVWNDEARRRGDPFRQRPDRALLVAVVVAGLAALAGASFGAHAAAYGGPLFAAVDFLHLAAVAAWLGVLPGMALLAWQARERGRDGRARRPRGAVPAALRGHVRIALAAAPIVALTGIANSPLVLGEPRGLVDSGYGNLLLGKAILFSTALGLGSASFLLLRGGTVRRAVALLSAEALIGAAAVLLAASMVTLQPAAGRAPGAAPAGLGTTHLYGGAGDVTIHVGVSAPSPGPQRYQVSVANARTGALLLDVEAVALIFTPPDGADGEERRVELQPQEGRAIWGGAGAYTPIVGEWQLDAQVRLAGGNEETATFGLAVAEAPPPATLPPPDTGVGVPAPLAMLYGFLPHGALGWLPALALFGAAAALAAFEVRGGRPRRSTAGLRAALMALALVAGLGAGARTVVEAANAPPPEVVAAANPIAPDPGSIERGRQLYAANCAACHASDGAGDGPAASGMLPPPGDLPAEVRDSTDGTLAYRIATGVAGTRMPPFAATLSEDDRWDLVNYLRARWGRPR